MLLSFSDFSQFFAFYIVFRKISKHDFLAPMNIQLVSKNYILCIKDPSISSTRKVYSDSLHKEIKYTL